jgi:hypothetical protein
MINKGPRRTTKEKGGLLSSMVIHKIWIGKIFGPEARGQTQGSGNT